jgi:phospholipase/lecithinase/hemolysin
MATQWLRRGLLLAACASALVLAACGGGNSIVSQFTPTRAIAFGDGMGDLGQNGARYTINDGSVNIWTQYVAVSYGTTLTTAAQGGLSYATGNARVAATPDAAGNANTPTVTQQIDTFLAGHALDAGDLVLVSAGTSDVIVETEKVLTGAETKDQALANLATAGQALGAQVRRLVNAGGQHVVVAGPYNIGRSPWALQLGQGQLMQDLVTQFNDKFLVSVVDLGANVLYVDAALYFNLVTANPSTNSITDISTPVCTTIDPGPGIGTGTNQVNSNLCTPQTLVAGANPSLFLFADRVYVTPRGQQLFGDYAFTRIKQRW